MDKFTSLRKAQKYSTPTTFSPEELPFTAAKLETFETFDAIYRALCAAMYNFAPLSGHPGGSVSSGRIVAGVLYHCLDYDFTSPDRKDSDIISYSAGHKAMGLYAHWALRDEIIRIAAPHLLPKDVKYRFRLEDLLGFRRNPVHSTPLFKKFQAKALDGHPSPATPYIRLTTGASGVGFCSSIGLGFATSDLYGKNCPVLHIIEGEGGLTPGRVSEAMASASTASLKHVIMHLDWNQASIDSDNVCNDGTKPGDYVQWNPAELCYLNDWNVITVDDGFDFQQILAAQNKALKFDFGNDQPTAIVYKTVKGWRYGVEGKKSHGGGHALCSPAFYAAMKPLFDLATGKTMDKVKEVESFDGVGSQDLLEEYYYKTLLIVREVLESNPEITKTLADTTIDSLERLNKLGRTPRENGPDISKIYAASKEIPADLVLKPDTKTTLRGELGRVIQYYNQISNGAVLAAAADLMGSTSVDAIGKNFAPGFYNAEKNPTSRMLSIGGICEDGMSGVMTGVSAFGTQLGVCSSYGAFMASMGHVASRLHAIGAQARHEISGDPYNPYFLVCAHAGVKTGEDGPTHADPQPLQLLQENFVRGFMAALTPWDPQEIWYLVSEALSRRPAIIAPFVTRPTEKIVDREKLGLAPASAAAKGVYQLRVPKGKTADVTIVLQGSDVGYAFVEQTLPMLLENNIDASVFYVASADLFDMLPEKEQEKIFPEELSREAIGFTGFTMPTMYRWIQSNLGRKHSLYPFKKGHYLGSGKAESVILEAKIDGISQYNAIVEYMKEKKKKETLTMANA